MNFADVKTYLVDHGRTSLTDLATHLMSIKRRCAACSTRGPEKAACAASQAKAADAGRAAAVTLQVPRSMNGFVTKGIPQRFQSAH